MGWSEPEMVCMKHPNHKQLPGVCSCCLNEKLSKLSGTPAIFNSSNNHQFSSPSNICSPAKHHYYSSGSSSSSPSHSRGHHHRTTSDVLNYSFVSSNGGGGLMKSRSIAVVVRGRGGGGGGGVRDGVNGKKKKQGFWSKLIKSTTGKRTKEGYVHPRMKDRFV